MKILFLQCAALLVWTLSLPAHAERIEARELLAEGQIYRVEGDGVNLRSSDTVGRNIMGQLYRGDRVRVLDSSTNFQGDFIEVEVISSRHPVIETDHYFMSFRFLSACPIDWRQALCASSNTPSRIFQADHLDQRRDHILTLTNPRIVLHMKSYPISHHSNGLDVCRMMGMQNLEQGILSTSSRRYERNLILDQEAPFDMVESPSVSRIRCVEHEAKAPRRARDTRALIIVNEADYDQDFMTTRGIEVFHLDGEPLPSANEK